MHAAMCMLFWEKSLAAESPRVLAFSSKILNNIGPSVDLQLQRNHGWLSTYPHQNSEPILCHGVALLDQGLNTEESISRTKAFFFKSTRLLSGLSPR